MAHWPLPRSASLAAAPWIQTAHREMTRPEAPCMALQNNLMFSKGAQERDGETLFLTIFPGDPEEPAEPRIPASPWEESRGQHSKCFRVPGLFNRWPTMAHQAQKKQSFLKKEGCCFLTDLLSCSAFGSRCAWQAL